MDGGDQINKFTTPVMLSTYPLLVLDALDHFHANILGTHWVN